ncbi:hypothetical protein LJ568_00250 [Bacillus halotolerans]|uniref:ABC transporter permease n=1 Tax=Bacillus halotolerans TaxID=260554 RepID=A0ABY7I4G0_9BACI|nr:hypothetical protein [Bacillus halotolerans]MCC2114115.1 hypothetical protein [Bacillus halotolerans]MDG0766285.1 hypothetical protein [Bacillus halotolerans]UUI85254.1 hypothetical protein NPA28_04940 [Bacillus halotolerans]WAT22306.1 hypothetical protein O0R52_04900 [Bacillus halotolerans]
MKPFWGLVKKDLRLSIMRFFACLGAVILLAAGSFLLERLTEEPLAAFGCWVMLAIFQVFLAPLLIYNSLRVEGKNQLWLYNPNGAAALLLSKLTAGLVCQFIFQFLISVYGVFLYQYLNSKTLIADQVPLAGTILIFNLYGLVFTAYLSCAVILLWNVFHSLKSSSSLIRRFRWFICMLLGIGWFYAEDHLIMPWLTPLDKLYYFTTYGDVGFTYKGSLGWSVELNIFHLPYPSIIVMLVLAAVFLFLASRLLQRKVEV